MTHRSGYYNKFIWQRAAEALLHKIFRTISRSQAFHSSKQMNGIEPASIERADA